VTIISHTDSTGSDAINNPLSIDRAYEAAVTTWSMALPHTVITIIPMAAARVSHVAKTTPQQGRDKIAGLKLCGRASGCTLSCAYRKKKHLPG
jgi:outer membrane protein OmpA-like peptidoglycan-associated protein